MTRPEVVLSAFSPLTVGSFGNLVSLRSATPEEVATACDVVEIRLDLLEAEGWSAYGEIKRFTGETPLLFTARRRSEGGAGDLGTVRRTELLTAVLDQAALVDVELASTEEMSGLLGELQSRGIPWVASWHDFEGLPGSFDLVPELAARAAQAGAACFKAAVRLHRPDELQQLAERLRAASPIPVSLMGMGPLAPVSRLLAAQCGSVLNYGYLGDAPTAPGQWSAKLLRQGILALEQFPPA